MDMELRNSQKKHGIKRLINSFKYSFAGLIYAFKYEQSMTIHILTSIVVVILGIIVKLSLMEWLFCLVIMGLVMATELINTAIEAVVDLTCPEKNDLAKIAKDTASAAVFVFAMVAALSGIILFIPKIIQLLK